MNELVKCTETVSYAGGWHFMKCGKPAKWTVNGKPRCGNHARLNNFYVMRDGRVHIKEPTKDTTTCPQPP